MKIPLFSTKPSETKVDPVCGMNVPIDHPPGGSWGYNNETYYFCGPGCNKAFQKEPEPYLTGEKQIEM